MKTAALPSIRIEPEFRDELEAALKEGESLTEFIEAAVRGGLRRRHDRAAFIARGLASLEEDRRTGVTVEAAVVLTELGTMREEAKSRRGAVAHKR